MAKFTKKEQEVIDEVFSGISLSEGRVGRVGDYDIVSQNYIYDFALKGDRLTILVPSRIEARPVKENDFARFTEFDTANVIKEVKKRALDSGLGINSVEVVRADLPVFTPDHMLVRRRIIIEGYAENPEDLPKLASL